MCGYYVIPEKCIPKIQGVLLVHDRAHGLFQPTSFFEYGGCTIQRVVVMLL